MSRAQVLEDERDSVESPELGDFTTSRRLIPISVLAIAIGFLSSLVAWGLLRLIGLFTNIFYFQRWDTSLVSPAGNHLGLYALAVPVIGGLVCSFRDMGNTLVPGHG